MADQEAATRQRIITHMNNDHHDSIIRYLQHHHHLSAWTASTARLTSISLDHMTFTVNNQTLTIPFSPPLKTYRETRERVVEMDKASREALGQSEITIQEFEPPTGIFAIPFLIIATTFLSYSQRWWFGRGEIVERMLGSGFAKFSWKIQPWIIGGMVVIHGAELAYFIPKYLRYHGVNPRTRVFWLWVATTFVEGQFAFMRFKALVERKREAKANQKH